LDAKLGRRFALASKDQRLIVEHLLNAGQRVTKLILVKEDELTVSRALELALFMDAKLDVSKFPPE
jgi:hypothetical protein